MKVFDLVCEFEHRFEGWFGSEQAFEEQGAQSLIACPMCGSSHVTRMPSAPRLNLSGAGERTLPAARPVPEALSPEQRQVQALWQQLARHVLENTEDVGERFAEEARRIHYQEAPSRGIRGQASAEEARSLADEGIEVMSLPLPKVDKGPIQ
ncbi:MAG: hypothetical protein RL322_170 [Pseudomonadota bacterium]|jgi:hypothetical protein